MGFKELSSLAIFFIAGIFMISRLGGIGKIIGFLFVAVGVIFLVLFLKDAGVFKKQAKEDERDAEIIRQAEEIEKLEKYDVDSGKGYCPHCGNYAVTDGRCEVCGEKVTE